ncbi:MAG: hypothetical protein ACKPKO_02060, partial [Candidatus Fonsibacter sp.]
MTIAMSRRFKSKVVQAPGANQQGPRPIVFRPEAPNQQRRTADTTWDYNKFFRNRQGPEPPVPPPTSGQEPRRKPKTDAIKKLKQTTRRSKKGVINAPVQDTWAGAWATAIGPDQTSDPPATDTKQPRLRFKRDVLKKPLPPPPTDLQQASDPPPTDAKKPRRRFKTRVLK